MGAGLTTVPAQQAQAGDTTPPSLARGHPPRGTLTTSAQLPLPLSLPVGSCKTSPWTSDPSSGTGVPQGSRPTGSCWPRRILDGLIRK